MAGRPLRFPTGGWVTLLVVAALAVVGFERQQSPLLARAESIQLAAILPKLEALHDEARALLIRNAELRSKILVGLQTQTEAKIKFVKSSRLLMSPGATTSPTNTTATTGGQSAPVHPSASSNQINTEQVVGNKTTKAAAKQSIKSQGASSSNNKNSTTSARHQQQQQQPATSITMKQKVTGGDPSNKSMIDFGELEDFNKWVEINLEYAVKNTQASAEALKEEALHNNGTVDYSVQAIHDGLEGVKYWQSAVMFQDKTLRNEKFDSPPESK